MIIVDIGLKEAEIMVKKLRDGGFDAPVCWYKALHEGHAPEDEKSVSKSMYTLMAKVCH